MPRGDGTGPMGMGPMTGRSAGFCAGYNAPGFMNTMPGRGFGMGRGGGGFGMGGGRGWRNRFYATGLAGWQRPAAWGWGLQQQPSMTKEQELDALKKQAEYFENSLKELRGEIKKIENSKEN